MCRNRVDSEEKLQTVRLILNGKESLRHAAERLGIRFPSIQQWISIYQSDGEDAFSRSGYKRYPKELKEQAVLDYISGRDSRQEICQRYGIRARSKLQNRIKKYNGHEELKAHGAGGTAIMTKGKKTTFDERAEIVEYCIAHDRNYAKTAAKYNISYQQGTNTSIRQSKKSMKRMVIQSSRFAGLGT